MCLSVFEHILSGRKHMIYNKHVWVTGEIVTAPLLNRMEEGIEAVSQAQEEASSTDCDELFVDFLEDEE